MFLHNPPGEGNAFRPTKDAPEELKHEEQHLREKEPKVNPWFCTVFLLAIIAITAVTAEMVCIISRNYTRELSKLIVIPSHQSS